MSVKIRPINLSDKSRMCPRATVSRITSSPMTGLEKASVYPNNVVSSTIFGKDTHGMDIDAGDKVFEDRYTRVGYMELAAPILNPFISGSSAPVWRKLLRYKKDEMTAILNGRLIWDNLNNEFVKVDDIGTQQFDVERYVYGAALLVQELKKVDFNKQLYACLKAEFVVPILTRSELVDYNKGEFDIGEIVELSADELYDALNGEIEGWFYGNFKLDLSKSSFPEGRRAQVLEDIMEMSSERINNNLTQYSIVDIILKIREKGIECLTNQVLTYIFVPPIGIRPTIDKRVDVLTSQYNKLCNANQELKDILDRQSKTVYAVMNGYGKVVSYLRNIFIGDDRVIATERLKDYKSLSDMITGKEGLMRSRMQGARVDYSGRTVIACDPDMDIDTIGVPRKMLEKIAEPAIIRDLRNYNPTDAKNPPLKFRNLTTFSTTSSIDRDGFTYKEYLDKWFENNGRYDRYGAIGRQPTLFYLGFEGFRIIPVDGDAILLSPLVVMPFNADFDGDQMYFNMPVTLRGQKELRDIIAFKNNMRYPKNGEVTVVTRHEIIYGLWICKSKCEDPRGRDISSAEIQAITDEYGEQVTGFLMSVYNAVRRQDINVYDRVQTKSGWKPAGIVALEYAIFGAGVPTIDMMSPDFKIKAKTITDLAMEVYGSNVDSFTKAINRIVHLGFSVAKIWPPNISVMIDPNVKIEVDKMLTAFNEDMLQREEYINMGLEIESEFSSYFSDKWKDLEKQVDGYLSEQLDIDNGYVSMWKSGAKGNMSNIRQIFGFKGRIQKNDNSVFNSIVTGSYAGKLTGLEHFVTAYGSRKGIADKVLATAEPGYLSRRLEHTGCLQVITDEDCGATEGMEFALSDIVPFLHESQISKFGIYPPDNSSDVESEAFWNKPETEIQYDAAIDYLAKILVGRYLIVDDDNHVYIRDEKTAKYYINMAWRGKDESAVVKMRSVIYCKKPCCKYCYGYDIAANKQLPDIGRAVGFIAAQAIGEPGTQLTMNNFHSGGVATEANLTNAFDLMEDYFELHDFSKKRKNKRGIISYDRISPVEGYVKVQYLGNGGKRIIVTNTNKENDRKNLIPGVTKIIVYEDVELKSYVKRGDSFQKIQGDLNMREVIKYRGYNKAVSYLTLMLYKIFSTTDVAFKHFETIVSDMTCWQLVADAEAQSTEAIVPYGKGSSYTTGSILTSQEMRYGVVQGVGVRTLVGLKTLPKYKLDFFESLLMENMDSYIPRAMIMNPNDSMSNPITRSAFGLNIGIGTDLSN